MIMSVNKYANLPDIDTAPDVYETDDVQSAFKADLSDDESTSLPAFRKGKNGTDFGALSEGLDSSKLLGSEEATKKFRKAERRQVRDRTHYAYPASRSPSTSPSREGDSSTKRKPLSYRLRLLQAELSSLETELADPTNPMLETEEENAVDAGELLRGLVDVRGRLDKIRKGKEGRGRLVGQITSPLSSDSVDTGKDGAPATTSPPAVKEPPATAKTTEQGNLVQMDQRVGELEKLIGSSTATLDETSPLPPPLLPQISRLQAQLALLTQPRHVDNISRRLKLLLSELDRTSSSQNHAAHRRQPSSGPGSQPPATTPSQIHDQLLPLLTRLAPSIPQIPHILTRLRTLSTLHSSAAEFEGTLESLEEDQRKLRETLKDLDNAVKTVETSLESNRTVVKGNVEGLDSRVDALLRRLENLQASSSSQ